MAPAFAPASRVFDDRLEVERPDAGDRVVVLRQRDPEAHAPEATDVMLGRPYAGAVIECVANVSEGRNMEALQALAEACGASLVDVHADADHNRAVFTLAGPGSRDACEAARALASAVATRVSIEDHEGQHPRFGALDVVPFVALGGVNGERAQAAEEARAFAGWWSGAGDVPVFLYDDADPEGRDLPHARSHTFNIAAAGLRTTRAAPAARRDRGRRASAIDRGELRARHP